MSEKNRYSESELSEFEDLILSKLEIASAELKRAQVSLQGDDIKQNAKVLEDGAATLEKQRLIQLIERQGKFVKNLENALTRIKNGTYGVCIDTGKLIKKERLMAVPHTQHSIEAKQSRK